MTRDPRRALARVGVALLGLAAATELADTAPRAQTWVGAAAGAALLLAVVAPARDDGPDGLARRARLLVGAGAAALLSVVGLWQATERAEPRVLLLLGPALLLLLTAGLALREAGRAADGLRTARLRARLEGEEAERRRWARELHDETLQDLAAVEVTLGRLEQRCLRADAGPGAAALAEDLADVRGAVRDRIGALRHLITQMRPLALDLLGPGPALEDLVRRAAEVGDLTGRCDVRELPALRPEAALGVYRVVQEAVTNAVRHSGGTAVEVRAQVRGRRLHVLVTDDGSGVPAGVTGGVTGELAAGAGTADGLDGSGLGVPGMTERARALGGRVTWTPAPGGGTVVDLDLPLADVGVPAGAGRDRQPAGVLAR